jgi:hypothetical protein
MKKPMFIHVAIVSAPYPLEGKDLVGWPVSLVVRTITRKSKTRDATRDDTSVEAETMARESCCAAAECWEVTRARL